MKGPKWSVILTAICSAVGLAVIAFFADPEQSGAAVKFLFFLTLALLVISLAILAAMGVKKLIRKRKGDRWQDAT